MRKTTLEQDATRAPRRWWIGAVLAAGVGVAALVPAAWDGTLLPEWGNPLEPEVVDRSQAPLLLALDDLAEYHAATGTYQVVVDLERDTPYVPPLISGERTTFLATGAVDAVVDFSDVGADRVEVSPDRRAVAITLPAPRLDAATVDPAASRVVGRDRGLVERVGSVFEDNPTSERELYELAAGKMETAAAESDLQHRAAENTRQMLTTLARSLGYERVTVTFEPPSGAVN